MPFVEEFHNDLRFGNNAVVDLNGREQSRRDLLQEFAGFVTVRSHGDQFDLDGDFLFFNEQHCLLTIGTPTGVIAKQSNGRFLLLRGSEPTESVLHMSRTPSTLADFHFLDKGLSHRSLLGLFLEIGPRGHHRRGGCSRRHFENPRKR